MESERSKASKPIIIGILVGAVLTACVVSAFLYIQQLHREIAETKAELISSKENLASVQGEIKTNSRRKENSGSIA